jgi:hypothetical protein
MYFFVQTAFVEPNGSCAATYSVRREWAGFVNAAAFQNGLRGDIVRSPVLHNKETHMKLTRTERWILANQYRILEVLYPKEADSLSYAREAFEHGL